MVSDVSKFLFHYADQFVSRNDIKMSALKALAQWKSFPKYIKHCLKCYNEWRALHVMKQPCSCTCPIFFVLYEKFFSKQWRRGSYSTSKSCKAVWLSTHLVSHKRLSFFFAIFVSASSGGRGLSISSTMSVPSSELWVSSSPLLPSVELQSFSSLDRLTPLSLDFSSLYSTMLDTKALWRFGELWKKIPHDLRVHTML